MFLRWLSFTCLYAVATVVGRSVLLAETGLSLFWPAAGVAALWAITARSRTELVVLCASIVAVSTTTGLLTGLEPTPAVIYAGADAIVAVVVRAAGRLLSARVSGLRVDAGDRDPVPTARLARVADVVRLLISAVLAACASALVGMLGLLSSGVAPSVESTVSWIVRYLTAIVVVTAPALAARSWRRVHRWPNWIEVTSLMALTVVVQWLVFHPGVTLPVSFVPLCLLFWSGFRMPIPIASVHGSFVALSTLALVYLDAGGALGDVSEPGARALVVQGYMLVVALLALLMSAALTERRHLTSTLRTAARQARMQAAQLSTLMNTLPGGLLVVGRDGHVLLHNGAVTQFLTEPDEQGRQAVRPIELAHLDGRPVAHDELPSVIALRGGSVTDLRMRHVDSATGRQRIISIGAVPLPDVDGGEPQYAVLLIHDATAEHERVEELRRAHEQAERLFTDAPHGLALLDSEGTILKANSGLAALAGLPEKSLTGRSLAELGEGDGAELREHLARTIAGHGTLTTTDWR